MLTGLDAYLDHSPTGNLVSPSHLQDSANIYLADIGEQLLSDELSVDKTWNRLDLLIRRLVKHVDNIFSAEIAQRTVMSHGSDGLTRGGTYGADVRLHWENKSPAVYDAHVSGILAMAMHDDNTGSELSMGELESDSRSIISKICRSFSSNG